MRHSCSDDVLYIDLYPEEDRESKALLYAAGRTHFLLLDLKLSSNFRKRTWASEFNGRQWAFLFWNLNLWWPWPYKDPVWNKLCTLKETCRRHQVVPDPGRWIIHYGMQIVFPCSIARLTILCNSEDAPATMRAGSNSKSVKFLNALFHFWFYLQRAIIIHNTKA